MTVSPRRILVTGAGGFVGRRLVTALLAHPALANAALTLGDSAFASLPGDPRVTAVPGDIADPVVRAALLDNRPDLVFHLAGVLGGAAEADYDLARRINLDATLSLIEALRDSAAPPRLVFASSIAVFGPPLPVLIDDDTPPYPTMIYGAQKRMIEIAIEQFSARGWIDGIALRLPGIVVRPGADAQFKSAFIHHLFDAIAAGEDVTLPVSPGGTTWLLSVSACVDALIHAALLPAMRPDARRALTIPAQCVAFGDLVAAIRAHFPQSVSPVGFAPDAEIEAQFGRQPPLETTLADRLGFVHDGDLATLVARAVAA